MAFFSTISSSVYVSSSSTARSGSSTPSSGHSVLAVACGSKLIVAEDTPTPSVAELSVSSTLLCAALSPSSSHLAACTDDKALRVWRREGDGGNWCLMGNRELSKRPTAVCFTRDERSVLIGDKTGEVYLYSLSDWSETGRQHLLGHFSMLLDMVLSPSNSHVITCDRDEKIRVSKFPNSYNIECFCLGHTDFVSSICVCPRWPHLLLSGSGDGSLKVWDWLASKLLSSQQVGKPREKESGASKEVEAVTKEVEAVTKVCCSSQDPAFVVTSVEKSPQLAAFLLSAEGVLTLWGQIQLQTSPWDIVFDWQDDLWVCQDSSEPVCCYRRKENEVVQISQNDRSLLKSLNKPEYFEGVRGASVKDWEQMRKNVVDNMGMYLARKEERLHKTKTDQTIPEETADSSQGTNGNELNQNSRTTEETRANHSPPMKKSKLENENV